MARFLSFGHSVHIQYCEQLFICWDIWKGSMTPIIQNFCNLKMPLLLILPSQRLLRAHLLSWALCQHLSKAVIKHVSICDRTIWVCKDSDLLKSLSVLLFLRTQKPFILTEKKLGRKTERRNRGNEEGEKEIEHMQSCVYGFVTSVCWFVINCQLGGNLLTVLLVKFII